MRGRIAAGLHRIRAIAPQNERAVAGHFVGELSKGVDRLFDLGVTVEVIRFDAQNSGMRGGEIEETLFVFAAFDDEQIAAARPAAGAPREDFGTEYRRRLPSRLMENRGGHGRCCALPVCAGDGDADLPLHQPAEHLAVGELRNSQLAGQRPLGIIGRDCRAIDHDVHFTGQELALVSMMHAQTARLERFEIGIHRLQVGPGHAISQTGEQFGEGLHA